MNALFLKDLAAKTHRGLRGRVEKGKAGGGLCYGYDVVKRTDREGEPVRGERQINEAEAAIVRRIFQEFAAGKSPRGIATDLNRNGIPGPFGRAWVTRRSEDMPAGATASSTTSSMPACWSGTGRASSRTRIRASGCRVRTPRRSGSGPRCLDFVLSMTSCGSG
ncbi:recombinase family protein [Bradyrhizobium sp. AZCC 1610]|uniref:recombinase family protein n=1 Tax=Bradyrhizobium sp. AZCC 1610 TaxID=3117020 RepID=UPI003FA5578E